MRFVFTLCFTAAAMFSAVVQADAASGQSAYASRGCIGCHGASGISVVATYPSLKGKSGDFIRKNLTDFRSGARKNPVMNAMAAGLSDADIENLGDYIGSLK
ncbi:MAG: cytochrome c [Gammaproteobacteria bacterium]|nr:cytochrome c [Gammaproteobacteria bacterium]